MTVSVIGAGNIGRTIITGLLDARYVRVEDMCISDPNEKSLFDLKRRYKNLFITNDNCKVAHCADVIIIAVKPWQFETVLSEIGPCINKKDQIIISIVAGVPFERIRAYLKEFDCSQNPIFRVIPNTAASLNQSVTFIAGDRAVDSQMEEVSQMFKILGDVYIVNEQLLVGGTSLASCGIAFAFKYLDSAIKGGEEVGFDRGVAQTIVIQTMRGALALLEENGLTPEEEIEKVTTPGGLTLRGLEAMNALDFELAVIDGILKSK